MGGERREIHFYIILGVTQGIKKVRGDCFRLRENQEVRQPNACLDPDSNKPTVKGHLENDWENLIMVWVKSFELI